MTAFEISNQLLKGVMATFVVTLSCFTTGFVTAFLIVILRYLKIKIITKICSFYILFFRSIPVIVMIFFVYFGLANFNFQINPLLAMNLSLGLITGAYLAEVFQSAFLAIDKTEINAAESFGFNKLQILFFIIMPQMIRFAFYGIINEMTSTLKNTAFAYAIGITEIMRQASTIVTNTNLGLMIYSLAGCLYFLLYKFLFEILSFINKKFQIPMRNAS